MPYGPSLALSLESCPIPRVSPSRSLRGKAMAFLVGVWERQLERVRFSGGSWEGCGNAGDFRGGLWEAMGRVRAFEGYGNGDPDPPIKKPAPLPSCSREVSRLPTAFPRPSRKSHALQLPFLYPHQKCHRLPAKATGRRDSSDRAWLGPQGSCSSLCPIARALPFRSGTALSLEPSLPTGHTPQKVG